MMPKVEPKDAATGSTPARQPASPRRIMETALFFLFVFTIYVACPIVTSGDSRFVIPTALSILRHGDADIDEYSHQFNEASWAFRTANGHNWNVYPFGVPLLSLPWVWMMRSNGFKGSTSNPRHCATRRSSRSF
jgi:hypothetical protein